MKKLFLILLAAALAFSLCACSVTVPPSTVPTDNPTPTMLIMTINPVFHLYLDSQGNVTKLEAANDDAQSILDQITYTDSSVQTVVAAIITVADANGFIQADTAVTFEVALAGSPNYDALRDLAQDAADQSVEALLTESTDSPADGPTDGPADGPAAVSPLENLQYFVEYLGNFHESGDMLKAGALQFEDGICVLVGRDFVREQQDEDQQPVVFNGTNYYSLGGGMEPYICELTDTEIIVTDYLWGDATGAVTLRLTLRSDGTLLVTESAHALFPLGTVLSTNIDDVI